MELWKWRLLVNLFAKKGNLSWLIAKASIFNHYIDTFSSFCVILEGLHGMHIVEENLMHFLIM